MSTREEAPATEVVASPPSSGAAPVYRMHLEPRPHVTFDESVVDNEHLGRKRSNKCCIFHKKREFGESSSESGEDSDDSDSDGHHHEHHQHDCKRKVRRRRMRPKKRAPSPSSSEEEKPAPRQ